MLVDGLSSSSVNLKVYFWLNGHEHSWLKVRSAVIRLVMRAFQDQGVTMPDEARERVFPREIPVRLIDSKSPASTAMPPQTLRPTAPETNATIAEGGLISDAAELEQ